MFSGAEKVIKKIAEIYPDADIFTTIYNPKEMDKHFGERKVYTSMLDKMPMSKKHYQYYLPFMPFAFESFDFSEYDIVISSSHSLSKGIITKPDTMHISYCHSPTRYLWDLSHEYINNYKLNIITKALAPILINKLRLWDRLAADRVDYFIANSSFIKRRIKKFYRREADVVNPFVNCSTYRGWDTKKDYYLIVSRLTAYKKVDLAIETFKELGLPLYVVGKGEDYKKFKNMNLPDNIKLFGHVDNKTLKQLYAHAKGFIFPQIEDFGITCIEALASGCPVIAFNAGGAKETVKENINGIFFDKQDVKSLKDAINHFETLKFDQEAIVNTSLEYDESVFESKFKDVLEKSYYEFQKQL